MTCSPLFLAAGLTLSTLNGPTDPAASIPPAVDAAAPDDAASPPPPSPTEQDVVPGTEPPPAEALDTAPADDPDDEPGSGQAPPPPSMTGGSPTLQRALNPDISVIGNFVGAAGQSPGGGEPALEMREAEVGLQSIVDPYARADFFLTFGPDEVGIEEGTLTFMALPGSLLVKLGRMRDAFGKVDAMHAHMLPTVDRPLVSQNLLGGEDGLADSGVSVSRLILVPGIFAEATGQVFRGESEVFHAPTRGDLAYVGHLRLYRDITESTNLDLGGSIAYGHNGEGPDATTRLLGADATFRYKPLRRAIYTHVLARVEATWSRRDGMDAPATQAFGAYAYLEYQFARRWMVAVRGDHSDRADDATVHDRGASLLLTFKPSEFSLVRAQYRHTRFGEERIANELLLQAQFAIGAHGAHPF